MKRLFGFDKLIQWTDLGAGVYRKLLVESPGLMLVKVKFETGSIGEEHHHVHEQTSYVIEGTFLYSIDGVQEVLNAGDSCIIPSGSRHGCKCFEAGILIDSFTPRRDDFL